MENNPLPSGAVAASPAMLDNRSRLLSYLTQRAGRKTAEQILYSAYITGLQPEVEVADNEKITNWFFRLVKKILADYEKNKATKTKSEQEQADWELKKNVGVFVGGVIETMKEDYSSVLKKSESENKISGGVLNKQLHRARVSLKKKILQTCSICSEHRCLNCFWLQN